MIIMENKNMMKYELRVIYKDGCCAVWGDIREVKVTYEELIAYPCDLLKKRIIIKRHNTIKAIKIAVKEW